MRRSLRCACEARSELAPLQLPGGPAAQGCAACGGTLLELDDYRRWRAGAAQAHAVVPAEVPVHDHAAARPCSVCTRLMQRLRVGATPDFRIDRCAACAVAWLDRGEWEALQASGLALRLEDLLTERWQRELQAEDARERRDAALRARHGDEALDELARMRAWLQAQPRPEELLALLRAGW
jgi:Zn-finger nucleic acid-binding protein